MLLNVHVRRKILRKGLDKICRLTGHGELRRMISVLRQKLWSALFFTFLLSENRDLLPVGSVGWERETSGWAGSDAHRPAYTSQRSTA